MNTFGVIVVEKKGFQDHGILNIIDFIGFEKAPTDEDFEKIETRLKSDEEFKTYTGGAEWFLMPTIGLMVRAMSLLDEPQVSLPPIDLTPPPEPKSSIILPFGNPSETPKIILN